MIVGGDGGGFYSDGEDAEISDGGGKGGKGYLDRGEGGAHRGGFRGGGGFRACRRLPRGGGGYSEGSGGANKDISCGGGRGSFHNGTNQHNECCYDNVGHGRVIIDDDSTFLEAWW